MSNNVTAETEIVKSLQNVPNVCSSSQLQSPLSPLQEVPWVKLRSSDFLDLSPSPPNGLKKTIQCH